MSLKKSSINLFTKAFFPGVNLHARDRFRRVPERFGGEVGPRTRVLDAGCGNGMLAYKAFRRGATVLAISIKQKEIDGCRAMFNVGMRIPESFLRFENRNLYDLSVAEPFDAIVCTEVLEHIADDRKVCRMFYDLLRPGGCLHVTSPNADHPYNRAAPLDAQEAGGHVRPGYTSEDYRALFEPLGFTVEEVSGLGGPIRQGFNWRIKATQKRWGAAAGVPLFFAAMPFVWLDSREPQMPFSLYARARKPS